MLTYYKEKIVDELKDAVDYMEKAVEHKGTWEGCSLKCMAENETEHAHRLLKMFNKAEKPETVTDADYAKMNKDILEAYTDAMNKFEKLKMLYTSL